MANRQLRRASRRLAPRQERQTRRQRRRRFVRYLAFGAVGLLLVAIIVSVVAAGGLLRPSSRSTPRVTPTGPGQAIPIMVSKHIPQAQRAGTGYYNSTPPTSGNHWPVWEKCGIHEDPIPNELQVHNLEHGFVFIQYHSQDKELIDKLKSVVQKLPGFPNYYLMGPYPDMEHTIALTAWGKLLTLSTVDEQVIRDFASAYVGQGPEPGAPSC